MGNNNSIHDYFMATHWRDKVFPNNIIPVRLIVGFYLCIIIASLSPSPRCSRGLHSSLFPECSEAAVPDQLYVVCQYSKQ